jgi:hypothetical protein
VLHPGQLRCRCRRTPAAGLSIGGAVNNTFRQVGSVLGVALLVAILGSPTTPLELVDAHQSGWLMISIALVHRPPSSGSPSPQTCNAGTILAHRNPCGVDDRVHADGPSPGPRGPCRPETPT